MTTTETIEELIAEYEEWCKGHGLSLMSAHELLATGPTWYPGHRLTDSEQIHLIAFLRRWEAAEETEQ